MRVSHFPAITLGALAIGLTGLLLPVEGMVRWLATSAPASPDDLRLGVWLLKGSLLATAAGVAALVRLPQPGLAGRSESPAATGQVTGIQWPAVAMGLVLLLALGLRVYRLDTELWLDEVDTLVRYARMPVTQLASTYASQNQHPLYLLLAKVAYLAFGGSDWSIRVPAALFGVASIWATFAFARRVASRSEAFLAALVLALSYHHVWFSQNARGYTAMLFFTPITTWLFLRLASTSESVPPRVVVAYAALIALAAYTHLTAVFIAIGHAVAFALGNPWRATGSRQALARTLAALSLSALLTVVLYALMLPQVLREVLTPTTEGVTVEWTSPWWLITETLRVLSTGLPGGLFTAAAGAAVLLVGVASYWRQSRLLALAMFCPVIVTAMAVVALHHNLWPRFFFFAAAFFVLAALRGGFVLVSAVSRAHGERIAVIGATVLAALSGVMLPRAWQPKQQYLAAGRFVEAERLPGDSVVALGVAAGVYKLRGAPADWAFSPTLDQLTAIEQSSRRTWVIYTFPVHLKALHGDLAQYITRPSYREVRIFSATVGGGELRVLLREAGATHD